MNGERCQFFDSVYPPIHAYCVTMRVINFCTVYISLLNANRTSSTTILRGTVVFLLILQIVICRHSQRVCITVSKFRRGTALDILYFRTLSACRTHSRSLGLAIFAEFPNYFIHDHPWTERWVLYFSWFYFTKILHSDIKDNYSER